MSTRLLVLAFMFVASSTLRAADPAAPLTLAGAIKDPKLVQKTADALGADGARVIRNQFQWDDFLKRVGEFGWQKPKPDPFQKFDFSREMIVCVLQFGDEKNSFSLQRSAVQGDTVELDVAMSYVIYKQRGEVVNEWKFFAVAVPRAEKVKLSVSTFHPMNGGPYPTADKALREWTAVLGGETGDIVAGLCGSIRPSQKNVKVGEDILIEITLKFANPVVAKETQFAPLRDQVHVWDGKYSNGYRNHSFIVKTPDGKFQLLRLPVQGSWDKNVPHLVKINGGTPYILPEWVEGQKFKPLKALGLDTSQKGDYEITGIYEEIGGVDEIINKKQSAWGGVLATNTVVVTVN